MPTLVIDIETTDLEERTKRDGSGTYKMQEAYAHTVDREGKPKRYPELFHIYAPLDRDWETTYFLFWKFLS